MFQKRTRIIIGIIIVIIVAAAFLFRGNGKSSNTPAEIPQDREVVLVHFVDNENPATLTSCGITRGVVRNIGKSDNMYAETLEELFKGPSNEEKATGLVSTFELKTNSTPEIKPLGTYFNGVVVDFGVATVDFKKEALAYLNGAACLQESVKQPIENTLNQFPGIEEIRYSIDGEVFTEWDA
jgi:spore germination protein GerM